MKSGSESSLADQRLAVRGQLQEQRQRIAEQLAPTGGVEGSFPRSVTMRLLLQRPELLPRLVALMARARVASSIIAILVIVLSLRFPAAGHTEPQA
jgi:hypothetical protein